MKALCESSPQAQRHFTRLDQVEQLVRTSEANPETGFIARLLALCSLPRTNLGRRLQYKRVNGPYTLIMTAVGQTGLPFGNLPRLLLIWVSTEAVRTQSRELFPGGSLSEFMRKLGLVPFGGGSRGGRTRLLDQMRRLFNAHIQLAYEDEQVSASVNSPVASRTKFWWNESKPDERVGWDSQIELGEKFFQEIIHHPVPLDMNILKALKRSSLGLDLYLWVTYRTFTLKRPMRPLLGAPLPAIRSEPSSGGRSAHRRRLSYGLPARVEKDQDGLAGSELRCGPGGADPSVLQIRHCPHAPAARGISSQIAFAGQNRPLGLRRPEMLGCQAAAFPGDSYDDSIGRFIHRAL